ncbi:unnamed protein product [Spodoptera exigua]|nr:unnamed protein product [Spodoptera exigua]
MENAKKIVNSDCDSEIMHHINDAPHSSRRGPNEVSVSGHVVRADVQADGENQGLSWILRNDDSNKVPKKSVFYSSMGGLLLSIRPAPKVLDYTQEKKKMREHNVLSKFAKHIGSQIHSAISGIIVNKNTTLRWSLNAAFLTAVIASMLLHPLDVFKVRLQMYPEVWGISLLRNMLRCEGIRAPFTGLSASILRQTTYTATRLGTYYCMYEHQKRKYNRAPSFPEKLTIGMYAGLLGAFVGCPSEIVLVRMMADGPVDPFRRYRGLMDAFVKIWKSEGFNTFWRGGMLTMSRSVVISVAQIGTYAQARSYLVEQRKAHGFLLHIYTSMLASLVTAIVTLPLDTFKTRYQVATNESHRDVYQKFKQETGMLGLWRGFTPYYVRLTIHTLITFYLLEVLFKVHRKQRRLRKRAQSK